MDRSNVETVFVAGQVRKWKGELVHHDIAGLRDRLVASRDHLFQTAGVTRSLFD